MNLWFLNLSGRGHVGAGAQRRCLGTDGTKTWFGLGIDIPAC